MFYLLISRSFWLNHSINNDNVVTVLVEEARLKPGTRPEPQTSSVKFRYIL